MSNPNPTTLRAEWERALDTYRAAERIEGAASAALDAPYIEINARAPAPAELANYDGAALGALGAVRICIEDDETLTVERRAELLAAWEHWAKARDATGIALDPTGALNAAWDTANDALHVARRALWAVPAPDLEALRLKFRSVLAYAIFELEEPEDTEADYDRPDKLASLAADSNVEMSGPALVYQDVIRLSLGAEHSAQGSREAWSAVVAGYEAEERSADVSDAGMDMAAAARTKLIASDAPDLGAVIYKLRLAQHDDAPGAVEAAIADLERIAYRAERSATWSFVDRLYWEARAAFNRLADTGHTGVLAAAEERELTRARRTVCGALANVLGHDPASVLEVADKARILGDVAAINSRERRHIHRLAKDLYRLAGAS